MMPKRALLAGIMLLFLVACGGRVDEPEYTLNGRLLGSGNGHLPPARSEVDIDCDTTFTGVYGAQGIGLTTSPYAETFKGAYSIRELRDAIADGQTSFSPGWGIRGRIIGLTTSGGNVSRRSFYIQDATGGILVSDNATDLILSNISELGKEITGTVTAADIFSGVYRIRTMTGVSVTANSDPLYVKNITTDRLENEGYLVRYCGIVQQKQPTQFSLSGKPQVYYGGSSPGTDDVGVLNDDYVTVLAPLTQFNGVAQVSVNQFGAYPANLSSHVKKFNRRFLKLISQSPAAGAIGEATTVNVSVTFDQTIPSLTMSHYFRVRQGDCNGTVVSSGEPVATNFNRTFTYNLSGLNTFTTYATCVSQLLYDVDGLYLQQPISSTWQTGDIYSFTAWTANSSPGVYPTAMTFRCTNTLDPTLSATVSGNYTGPTNVSETSFGVRGEGAGGISVLNTGTANANCKYDGTNNGFMSAIDVAISTTGKTNIRVSWKAAQISDQTREYGLRLQYNCGSGFSDTSPDFSSVTAGTSTSYFNFGPTTLPAACNNQSSITLRWRYYHISGSSGSRTRIALDDVFVTGD